MIDRIKNLQANAEADIKIQKELTVLAGDLTEQADSLTKKAGLMIAQASALTEKSSYYLARAGDFGDEAEELLAEANELISRCTPAD